MTATKQRDTLEPTGYVATLGMMAIADIKVLEGFNVRQDLGDVVALASSIQLLGILQPVIVDPDGFLIDGHRRLAAAVKAGLDEVPTIVQDPMNAEAIAGVSNIARVELSPAEEADAIQRMLTVGFTPAGTAVALGMSMNKVTRRLDLLKLPEPARELYRSDQVKQDTLPAVLTLTEKVPALTPLLLAAQELTADEEYWDRVDVRKLADDPAEYIEALRVCSGGQEPRFRRGRVREALEGMLEWPEGLVVVDVDTRGGIDVSDSSLAIGTELVTDVTDLTEKAAKLYIFERQVKFNDDDLDAARAAGVLIELEGLDGRDARFVADSEWLKDRLESAVIPRFLKSLKAKVRIQQTQDAKRRGKTTVGADATAEEKKAAAAAERRREKEKEWAAAAPGANLDLGRELLAKLANVQLSRDVALFFAETTLGQRPGAGYRSNEDQAVQLAAGGLRYVMPGWQTEKAVPTKADPHRTKTDYLEPADAEKRLWEWFDRADTPGEILGRALVIHAAARWAVENHLAVSNRTLADHEPGANQYKPRWVAVPKGPARDALERIVTPILPQTIKDLIADIRTSTKA